MTKESLDLIRAPDAKPTFDTWPTHKNTVVSELAAWIWMWLEIETSTGILLPPGACI